MKEGKVIACVSEERLVREKEWGGFPKLAIEEVIDIAGFKSSEIDYVAIASNLEPVKSFSSRNHSWFRRSYSFGTSVVPKKVLRSSNWVKTAVRVAGRDKKTLEKNIKDLGIKGKIFYFDHHDCHAATAHYFSGFDKSLVLTNDGGGDGLCATIQLGNKNELNRVSEVSQYNSIGRLYSAVTEYLGMKPLSHEYKVMGMAAYCKEEHIEKTYNKLSKFIQIDKKDPLKFNNISGINPSNFANKLHNLMKFERFDNVSGAVQKLTEELLVQWTQNAIDQYGVKNIALSGGVFMNVKANQRILSIPDVKKLFIMPSCGDESIGLGASILLSNKLGISVEKLGPIYFGRQYDSNYYDKVISTLDKKKYQIDKRDDINAFTGERLVDGHIIGRHNGRMEFGSRALDNRSILTDPRNLSSVSKINEAIKNRDFWMPFTPSVLHSEVGKYIVNEKKHFAPYMITTFDSTNDGRENLKAAIHQKDFTTRPQMVKKSWNDSYHNLLSSFHKNSGVSGCLNTSFNLHGYPIVNSPEDALYVFDNSKLDALSLGDYFITKS